MANHENDPLYTQTGLTSSERAMRGSLGGLASWANTADRSARMAKVRRSSPADWQWHANRLDPNHELPDDVRYQRGEAARRSYFAKLALRSAVTRRRRRG